MENKDINTSKFGVGLFIGILVTLVLVMGGYLVYDKVIKNNDKQNNNDTQQVKEEEKEVAIDLSNSELSNLYNFWVKKVLYNYSYTYGENGYIKELENNTDAAKVITAFLALEPEQISCSKASNVIYIDNNNWDYFCSDVFANAERYMNDVGYIDTTNQNLINELKTKTTLGFSKSKVDSKIKELFGVETYNLVDVHKFDTGSPYHYDSSANAYLSYSCYNCGGTHIERSKDLNKLISATKKGNTINMKVSLDAENENFSYEEYSYQFEYNKTTNSYNLKSFQKIK